MCLKQLQEFDTEWTGIRAQSRVDEIKTKNSDSYPTAATSRDCQDVHAS